MRLLPLREVLDALRAERAVVLHERRIRGTSIRIPHLVVASVLGGVGDRLQAGGGRVEKVSVGRWLRRDERLCLDGADRRDLLADVLTQVDAVGLALVREDYDGLPLHRALALLKADWPLEGEELRVRDIVVASPSALVAMIRRPGPVSSSAISAVDDLFGRAFPAG